MITLAKYEAKFTVKIITLLFIGVLAVHIPKERAYVLAVQF